MKSEKLASNVMMNIDQELLKIKRIAPPDDLYSRVESRIRLQRNKKPLPLAWAVAVILLVASVDYYAIHQYRQSSNLDVLKSSLENIDNTWSYD